MSKKAAEGLVALVLDVKVGKAALLADKTAARQLAQLLVIHHFNHRYNFIIGLIIIIYNYNIYYYYYYYY